MASVRNENSKSGKVMPVLVAALLVVALVSAAGYLYLEGRNASGTHWPTDFAETGWRELDSGDIYFEGPRQEYSPGVTYQHILKLDSELKRDPSNGNGSYILKFDISEEASGELEFVDQVPKRFATNVNDLRFRILKTEHQTEFADLDLESSTLCTIGELEQQGLVRVIDEDPVMVWIISLIKAGSVAIVADFAIDKGNFIPVFTRMDSDTELSEKQLVHWADSRLRDYCDVIQRSAVRNGIPPRLLSTVILTELADYNWLDQNQEFIYSGSGRSHGEVQLAVDRLFQHGIIDVALTPDTPVRDPKVDITYEEYSRIRNYPEAVYNALVCEKIQRFESGIEFAAREIAYLLGLLQKGSPYLKNPWPQALLEQPEEGISLNNIYANLKIDSIADQPVNSQYEKERTLALLVASAYNGWGAIYKVKNPDQIFVTRKYPWARQVENARGIQQAVTHGCNAMEFAELLYKHHEICPFVLPPGRYLGTLVETPGIQGKRKNARDSGGGYDISADQIVVQLNKDNTIEIIGDAGIVERWRFNEEKFGPFNETFFSYTRADYSHRLIGESSLESSKIGPSNYTGKIESDELLDCDGSLTPPGFDSSGGEYQAKTVRRELDWYFGLDQLTGQIRMHVETDSHRYARMMGHNPNPVSGWHFEFAMTYQAAASETDR